LVFSAPAGDERVVEISRRRRRTERRIEVLVLDVDHDDVLDRLGRRNVAGGALRASVAAPRLATAQTPTTARTCTTDPASGGTHPDAPSDHTGCGPARWPEMTSRR